MISPSMVKSSGQLIIGMVSVAVGIAAAGDDEDVGPRADECDQ